MSGVSVFLVGRSMQKMRHMDLLWSAEFQNKGMSDTDYIKTLYAVFLTGQRTVRV